MRRQCVLLLCILLCGVVSLVESFSSHASHRIAATTPTQWVPHAPRSLSLPSPVPHSPHSALAQQRTLFAVPPQMFSLDQSVLPAPPLSPAALGAAAAAVGLTAALASDAALSRSLIRSLRDWARQWNHSLHTLLPSHKTHTHKAISSPHTTPSQRPLSPQSYVRTALTQSTQPSLPSHTPQNKPTQSASVKPRGVSPTAQAAHSLSPTQTLAKPPIATGGKASLISSSTTHSGRSFPWAKCRLIARATVNELFTEYTFEASGDKALSLHKAFGRQIIICGADADGNLLKQSFCPVLPAALTKDSRRFKLLVDNRTLRTLNQKPSFARSVLPTVRVLEEELAVKIGAPLLSYAGPEESIRSLTIVASAVGIVPVLQLLQRVLRDTNATDLGVEHIELLWINDAKQGFLFDKEVALLEKDFPETFSCARVMDSSLRTESPMKDKLLDALSKGSKGRVAIIAAAPPLLEKISNGLVKREYARENIVTIDAGP